MTSKTWNEVSNVRISTVDHMRGSDITPRCNNSVLSLLVFRGLNLNDRSVRLDEKSVRLGISEALKNASDKFVRPCRACGIRDCTFCIRNEEVLDHTVGIYFMADLVHLDEACTYFVSLLRVIQMKSS